MYLLMIAITLAKVYIKREFLFHAKTHVANVTALLLYIFYNEGNSFYSVLSGRYFSIQKLITKHNYWKDMWGKF